MAKVTISLTLDDERDKKILRWLKSQSGRGKSEAMRRAINSYLGQDEITLRDIYDEIQELKRGGLVAVIHPGQGSQEEQQVSREVLDRLSKLGA
jgi:hypothetical protein